MDLAVDQKGAGNQLLLSDMSVASLGIRPVRHVAKERDTLIKRRCGRIVTQAGRLRWVSGRWWPHLGNLMQVYWDTTIRNMQQDRCELFYHQAMGSSKFITLSYVHSGPRTSLSSLYAATLVLDEIARLKQAQAIVCNVTNDRISDRLFQRWGWTAHCPDWSGRHFIKRFYGQYPEIPSSWRLRLGFDTPPSPAHGASARATPVDVCQGQAAHHEAPCR